MTSSNAVLFCSLLLGLPLAGSLLNALLGPKLGRRFVNIVGPGSIGLAFVVALVVLATILGAPDAQRSVTGHLWTWMNLGSGGLAVNVDMTLDQLSTVMILVITGVGFLIHVYSVGYMEHDPDVARFFSFMNFFIFSMLTLVLAADVVILIIGWALVALSSYLLIGFWYQRPSAVAAARKAFITQVVGDVALVIAAFMIVTHGNNGSAFGSLSLPKIFANAGSFQYGGPLITGICLLLAIGAFAKSAQFPLHTWLPDAMEGPTPVSALIHAATMVTAGVYLIARFHPLFNRAPLAQGVVAWVGMGTALMAGIIALSQVDIKRVIAYSTMSQIGLMIFAVGIGAYTAGMFHFVTHAVFKALLFMAAGNVIHALHDEQDIRLMGGLASRMKQTSLWFLCGSLALAGIPIWAGFFSKENLLGFALGHSNVSAAWILYLLGLIINVLTGLYAFRLYFTVFTGEHQTARGFAAHEPGWTMRITVAILGVGSVIAGLALWLWPTPGVAHPFASFLDPAFSGVAEEASGGIVWIGLVVGTLASLIGVGLARQYWYERKPDAAEVASRLPRLIPQLSLHKFYFDELYDYLFARPATALARGFRRLVEPNIMNGWVGGIGTFMTDSASTVREWQTGYLRDYAGAMTIGAVVIVIVAAFMTGGLGH